MTRLCSQRGRPLLLLLLSVCWVACARPGASDENAAQVGQQVPFRGGSESTSAGPSYASIPLPEAGSSPPNSVPFRDPQNLPAGTLLTVRLKSPIASDGMESGNAFAAIVDEAVVLEGTTLVPRGATVVGRVESARSYQPKRSRGLVRLTLKSIDISGRDLAVQTSSLFARGKTAQADGLPGADPSVVRLEQGRRLTFRLTEPIFIAQLAVSSH
jgi:hypothetical protein